jgi:hypothetical protein
MLKDVLVLHWGSVVAWLQADMAAKQMEQPMGDYPWFGIQAGEDQIQAVKLMPTKNLTITRVCTKHNRKGTPDDATMTLTFVEPGADGLPNFENVTLTVAEELAYAITGGQGGEVVAWDLDMPLVLLQDQPMFMVLKGNWSASEDHHVRVFGDQGYEGPHKRWMWRSSVPTWTEYPSESLFFELYGYETGDSAFLTNPDTSVVVAERIVNPENLRLHLQSET